MATLRRRGAVRAAPLACVLLSFPTAHALVPEWSREAGLDVWNLPDDREKLRAAAERRAEVEAWGARAARRREAADRVAERLARGAALAAGADELMALFRGDAGMRGALAALYHDAPTLRHAFALHAVDRVRRTLEHDPARRGAVLVRLEAEYLHLGPAPESPRH
jgi:hypothetical protein